MNIFSFYVELMTAGTNNPLVSIREWMACTSIIAFLLLLPIICVTLVLPTVPPHVALAASSSNPSPNLLVLVISSHEPLYRAHLAVWRMMAAAAPKFGIQVYFVTASEEHNRVTISGHDLAVPGRECLVPCILLKTITALDALIGPNAPAHTYEYVLRTNLSSLWVWARFIKWVNEYLRPRGTPIMASSGAPSIMSGAGTVWSLDVARLLVVGNHSLDFTLLDDMAMTKYLLDQHIPTAVMQRTDFSPTEKQPLPLLPSVADSGAYHYRCKAFHDRERYDGYIMARLFAEAYSGGPGSK